MIQTYWKRGDKREEMDTNSFNGQAEKKQQISAFIHHGDDRLAIGVTIAPDARVHTLSQGRLRGAPAPFYLPSSPLSLHICDWQLSQRRGWRQGLSPRRRLWVKSDTLKDEREREKKKHISVQRCTPGHCFIAVMAEKRQFKCNKTSKSF